GGLVLADDAGVVNADNDFGTDRMNRENPAPANIGVKNPSVMQTAGALPPSTSLRRSNATMGFFDATWAGIRPRQFSSIVGFTTNVEPFVRPKDIGAMGDNRAFPIGQAPTVTAVPEPSTVFMLGLTAPLWSWLYRHQRHSGSAFT